MWRILVFIFLSVGAWGSKDCRIKIPTTDANYALYFNYFNFLNPKRSLSGEAVHHGATIDMTCETGFVTDHLAGKTYTLKCTDGVFNNTFVYEDLLCRASDHQSTETLQISPTEFGSTIFKCDQNNWIAYKVQVKKRDGSTKHIFNVCFDKELMKTKFVFQPKHKNDVKKSNETRVDVWGLDRYGSFTFEKLKLAEGYMAKYQQDRITNAFNDRYNQTHKYPYKFDRGHLAPYADFFEIEARKASCLYINIAPQWREFNSNTWANIEKDVRNLVEPNSTIWDVYTGTFNAITTKNGPLMVSFIPINSVKKWYVPVPKLYWKIAYNAVDKTKSVVIIGINNPELKTPEKFPADYVVCKPIPDSKGNIFQGSATTGFVYNCKLEDFLERLRTDEKIVK